MAKTVFENHRTKLGGYIDFLVSNTRVGILNSILNGYQKPENRGRVLVNVSYEDVDQLLFSPQPQQYAENMRSLIRKYC